MITILIFLILKQIFSSLHKEFIDENNLFDYAVVLSAAKEIQFLLSCFYKVHAVYPNICIHLFIFYIH